MNGIIENEILTDEVTKADCASGDDSPIEEVASEEVAEQLPSVEELNLTIASLKSELEAYRSAAAQQEAIAKQINEFSELFPDISVRSIPNEVWDDVKNGNSLAAAYSVYERRITEAAKRIELINQRNAERSAGVAGKNTAQEFFSADDVRKMSPGEVRANYAKIRRSMEKWN